jgi:hypothetical protein
VCQNPACLWTTAAAAPAIRLDRRCAQARQLLPRFEFLREAAFTVVRDHGPAEELVWLGLVLSIPTSRPLDSSLPARWQVAEKG